jgi:hypothetical protein
MVIKLCINLCLEKIAYIFIRSDFSFGSLNVNFTIVISNTAESVENFTKSTVDLAKGVSIEVLNESLAVTNMSVGENSGIVTYTAVSKYCFGAL